MELEKQEKAQSILEMKELDNYPALTQNDEVDQLTVVTDLPSGFKGYPKGTKISFSPVTLKELEALNPSEDKDIDVTEGIALLLKSIHCNTVQPQDLYYWDVMYIGIQRKLQAFGNTKGTLFARCPKCGNIVNKQFNYTDLEFKELQVPALPMKMTISNQPVEFGLITIKQFLEIDVSQGALGVYARMIKNMSFEDAYKLVQNAVGIDIKKILFVDKQLDYGLKPFTVKCNAQKQIANPGFDNTQAEGPNNKKKITKTCDEQVVVEVTSPFEVVFPENTDNGDLEFEVQYGD